MGSRILVHESVYDVFVKKLSDKVSKLRMGDPQDPNTQIGPVITSESREKIHAHVQNAIGQGATLVQGGRIEKGDGFYYSPTILGDVTEDMDVFSQEIFGPVVSVTKFSSPEGAIRLANASEFGLAASIWTRNLQIAHKVAKKIDCGIIWINGHHRRSGLPR